MKPQPQFKYELSPKALEIWNPALQVVDPKADNTISIFDVIGTDYWTGEGVTAKRISAALRSIGDGNDVVVNINSPGGDMFEGLAIYNLLREHKGKVTVKVLGVAASAASIIAMAGDSIEISKSAFLMIHNAWIMTAGNRHDFRDAADFLEPFDSAMADIYAERTKRKKDEIESLMDAETWINGTMAIEQGFADDYLPADSITQDGDVQNKSTIKLDIALAKAGLPRTERRKLLAEIKADTLRATGENDTLRAISFKDELTALLTLNIEKEFKS